MKRARKREQGFSLIELGIVIGVIAILITVVAVGQGFILTSRVTKAVDAVDVIRKATSTISGTGGGQFPTNSTANEMGGLQTRGFIPASPWTPMQGFVINNVQWSTGLGPANRVGVQITCPAGQCVDVWNAYNQDPNRITAAGNAGTLPCTVATPADTAVGLTLCFQI